MIGSTVLGNQETEQPQSEQPQSEQPQATQESRGGLNPSPINRSRPDSLPILVGRSKSNQSGRSLSRIGKAKKNQDDQENSSNEKNLFSKIFGRSHKTENIVNVDLIETQSALDTRAQYGDVRDLIRTDSTGRTIIHRAALEQNSRLLNELCEEAAKTNDKLAFIDRRDVFGNTPLLLSCLLNISQDLTKRTKCLDILINHGVDINVSNKRTLWTPIMWCAYYGDDRAVRKLIVKDAKSYCPDYKGFFPFDWAGLKGHATCLELIVGKLIVEIEFIESNSTAPDVIFKRFGEQEKYLRSPLLRSSLLYWACYYKLDLSLIERLLSFSEVIPEFPLSSVQNKTSIHACCEKGYTECLTLLLEKCQALYDSHPSKHKNFLRSIDHHFGRQNTNNTAKTDRNYFILPLNKEEKKKFKKKFLKNLQNASTWYVSYLSRIYSQNKAEVKKYKFFDCKDLGGNTPLHLASYHGHDRCALILLKMGSNMDAINNEGWMCKELQKHETIQQIYQVQTSENLKQEISQAIAIRVGLGLISLTRKKEKERENEPGPSKTKIAAVYPERAAFRRKTERKGTLTSLNKANAALKSERTAFDNTRMIPDVVIKFKIEDRDSERKQFLEKRMDFYLQILTQTSFDIYLAPSIYQGTFLVMLKMDDENLSKECSQLGLKMKLLNSYQHKTYEDSKKTEFEPFRTLQRQEIAINALKKFIDVDLLLQQNVIQDYFRMHTVAGLQKIRDSLINNSRWYWPQPLNQISNFTIENRNNNYPSITALKQYFGEKIAFYFAFSSFLTCYLFFLAVPGVALQIYLFVRRYSITDSDPDNTMYNTFFVAIWVLYVLVWNTITVERWKRKNAEIATRWGITRSDDFTAEADDKLVRKEFIGDECISGATGALTKKFKTPITTITFLASLPVLVVLLGGVVGCFILTNSVKNFGRIYKSGAYSFYFQLLAGVINGATIAALNITYSMIARWFVKKENHKYQVYYERSLIFKSFTFRFLNSFIGVFYVAFIEKDSYGNGSSLWDIFILLLTLVFTKQISSIVTLSLLPWIRYKIKQISYFKLATRKALNQAAMGRTQHTLETEEQELLKEQHNRFLLFSRRGSKNLPKESLVLKRPVLDLKRGISDRYWELQQVELNSIRITFIDLVDSYGEIFVLLGFITLFASAFPLGPLIALVNSIFDSRSRLYSFLNVYDRPEARRSSGIGSWLQIWEFLSIASIVRFHIEFGLENVYFFNQTNDFSKLLIFVIAEHLIFLLKYFLADVIPDKPLWVKREEEKQQYLDDLELETIKARELQQRALINSTIEAKTQEKISQIQTELEAALHALEIFKQTKQIESSPSKDTENLELKSAVKTMLYASFVVIERELILSRISNLSSINKAGIVIKCTSCAKRKAIIECKKSREFVCKECYFNVQSKLNFADEIDIIPYIGGDGEIDSEVRKEVEKNKRGRENLSGKEENPTPKWRKFEYFSFPTNPKNETYPDLSQVFKILYKIYITENGIDKENKVIDSKKFFKIKIANNSDENVESLPSLILSKHASSMLWVRSPSEKSVFKGEIDRNIQKLYAEFTGDSIFNDEEKLFLNRVAFLIFKRNGANSTFSEFLRVVRGLQEGQFENKIYVLFDLLDEDDDGLISVSDLKRIARTCYMQSTSLRDECEKVLDRLAINNQTLNKKTAMQLFISDTNIKAIISSLLQAY